MTPFISKDPAALKYLEQLRKYPAIGGLDLSQTTDLTSFVLAWSIKDKVYVFPWYFLPSDELQERSYRDAVPYTAWLEAGHVEVCQGSIVDYRYVTERIAALASYFDIKEIGYDRNGSRQIVTELSERGISCVDVNQNMVGLSAAAKRFEELVLSRKLVHSGHPVLRWNLDCSTIFTDNGNIKVIKPDLKKSTKRIDGIVAAVIALSRIQKAPPVFKSVYAERGLLTL
jgi:phage terminase large subunit-like protein